MLVSKALATVLLGVVVVDAANSGGSDSNGNSVSQNQNQNQGKGKGNNGSNVCLSFRQILHMAKTGRITVILKVLLTLFTIEPGPEQGPESGRQ